MIPKTYRNFYSEHLLERICYTTEFEVEGWRKIPPLIELLQKYTNRLTPNLKLEMKAHKIFPSREIMIDKTKNNFQEFDSNFLTNTNKKFLVNYPMKKSFINNHFRQANPKKLTVYVSQVIPINQKYFEKDYTPVRLHVISLVPTFM